MTNELYRQLARERFTHHVRAENEPAEDNDVLCATRRRELLEAVGGDAEAAA